MIAFVSSSSSINSSSSSSSSSNINSSSSSSSNINSSSSSSSSSNSSSIVVLYSSSDSGISNSTYCCDKLFNDLLITTRACNAHHPSLYKFNEKSYRECLTDCCSPRRAFFNQEEREVVRYLLELLRPLNCLFNLETIFRARKCVTFLTSAKLVWCLKTEFTKKDLLLFNYSLIF